MKRRTYLAGVGGTFPMLAGCLGGGESDGNDDEAAETEEGETSDETTSTSDPEPSPVAVGEQHTIGELAITVEEIEVDDERSNSDEDTHAVLLHLVARNLSETRVDGPSPNDFLLHSESEQWDWANFGTFDSGEILPEKQSSGWVGYRIPQSISAEDLSASYLTDEKTYRWEQ